MNMISQLAQVVTNVDADQFVELFNELNNTEHSSLDDIINSMKMAKLNNYMIELATNSGAVKVVGASRWDRNTAEGKAANCEASKKSREKKKAREMAEAEALRLELAALKAAK